MKPSVLFKSRGHGGFFPSAAVGLLSLLLCLGFLGAFCLGHVIGFLAGHTLQGVFTAFRDLLPIRVVRNPTGARVERLLHR